MQSTSVLASLEAELVTGVLAVLCSHRTAVAEPHQPHPENRCPSISVLLEAEQEFCANTDHISSAGGSSAVVDVTRYETHTTLF